MNGNRSGGLVERSHEKSGRDNSSASYYGKRVKYLSKAAAKKLGVPCKKTKILGVVSVETVEVWVRCPHPKTQDWAVLYRVVVQDGQPVVAELRVFPAEADPPPEIDTWSAEVLGVHAPAPQGGITTRLVRNIRVGDVDPTLGALAGTIEGIRRNLHQPPRGFRLPARAPAIQEVLDALAGVFPKPQLRPRPTKGRRGKPDIFFAELAREYTALLNDGNKHPVTAIAKRRKIERSKVRDMIHAARKRGFLSLKGHGQTGGQLTPEALALLDEAKKGILYGSVSKTKKR